MVIREETGMGGVATPEEARQPKDTKSIPCSWCGGDGKEHCDNPDHNFIAAVGGEISRLGCPLCKFPESTLVIGGGDCDNCNGAGLEPTVDIYHAERSRIHNAVLKGYPKEV